MIKSKLTSLLNKDNINIMVVAFWTLLSRVSGFLRDIAIAYFLGTGVKTDIFFAAFKLPNAFRRIFAEGAMMNAFVPVFGSEINSKDDSRIENAKRFSGGVLLILLVILMILILIMEFFLPTFVKIINPGFVSDAYKFKTTVSLSHILFPFLGLISLSSLLGAILNSISRFSYFSSIQIILNAFSIIALMIRHTDLYFLSYAVILSGVAQLFVLYFGCKKHKVLPNIRKPVFDGNVKKIFKNFVPALFSNGIQQINVFIDTIFASFFGGAVSYLYYVDRVFQLPLSLLGYTISTVALSALSKYISVHDSNAKNLKVQSVLLASFFSIPLMIFLIYYSEYIISFIYFRGSFKIHDVYIVSSMLSLFAVALPFNIINKVSISFFFASGHAKFPVKISIISLVLNIVFNFVFIEHFGQFCVIIATTLSSTLIGFFSLYGLHSKNIFNLDKQTLYKILNMFISSAIAIFLVKNVNIFFSSYFLSIITSGAIFMIIYGLLYFGFLKLPNKLKK